MDAATATPPAGAAQTAPAAPQPAPSSAVVAAAARAAALAGTQRKATAAATPARPTPPSPAPVSQKPASPAPPAKAPNPWSAFFSDWPAEIPQRGIVVTKQNENSPFKGFMLRGDFVLLERTSPDSLGGRFLVVPFDEIAVIKFTDPLRQPALESSGFVGKLSQ